MSLWYLVPLIDHLPPVCWSTSWKSSFNWQWLSEFHIMENIIFIVLIIFLQLSECLTIWQFFFSFTIFHVSNSPLFFTRYSVTILSHRRSIDTFYLHLDLDIPLFILEHDLDFRPVKSFYPGSGYRCLISLFQVTIFYYLIFRIRVYNLSPNIVSFVSGTTTRALRIISDIYSI